jgi:TPR repeat protein
MRHTFFLALLGLAMHSATAYAQAVGTSDANAKLPESELSYRSYIHSDKRIKCLYGYAANKTGDHAAAIALFEDCIRRWNDVFSMIGLAQMYETGIGMPQDAAASTALMRRAAQLDDGSSYPSLARYHYGVALAEGYGVPQDVAAARTWLRKAAAEGVNEAADYLARLDRAAP